MHSHAHFVASHPHLRLGRKPRVQDKLLKFHDLAAERDAKITQPVTFDYSVGLPGNTGVLLNDRLGCCTAAAKYHRLQVLTFKLTGKFLSPDALNDLVLKFYEGSTGYDPSDPSTDQGGDMQSIAEYLLKTGMPMPGGTIERFIAAYEIDVGNQCDLSYCGQVSGGIDLGIQVTTSVMPADGSDPPLIWDVSPDDKPLGGHDVIAIGRKANGNWIVISWGMLFELTPAFWRANVQEAYGYVSHDWINATGKTPLNMSVGQWESAMAGHSASV